MLASNQNSGLLRGLRCENRSNSTVPQKGSDATGSESEKSTRDLMQQSRHRVKEGNPLLGVAMGLNQTMRKKGTNSVMAEAGSCHSLSPSPSPEAPKYPLNGVNGEGGGRGASSPSGPSDFAKWRDRERAQRENGAASHPSREMLNELPSALLEERDAPDGLRSGMNDWAMARLLSEAERERDRDKEGAWASQHPLTGNSESDVSVLRYQNQELRRLVDQKDAQLSALMRLLAENCVMSEDGRAKLLAASMGGPLSASVGGVHNPPRGRASGGNGQFVRDRERERGSPDRRGGGMPTANGYPSFVPAASSSRPHAHGHIPGTEDVEREVPEGAEHINGGTAGVASPLGHHLRSPGRWGGRDEEGEDGVVGSGSPGGAGPVSGIPKLPPPAAMSLQTHPAAAAASGSAAVRGQPPMSFHSGGPVAGKQKSTIGGGAVKGGTQPVEAETLQSSPTRGGVATGGAGGASVAPQQRSGRGGDMGGREDEIDREREHNEFIGMGSPALSITSAAATAGDRDLIRGSAGVAGRGMMGGSSEWENEHEEEEEEEEDLDEEGPPHTHAVRASNGEPVQVQQLHTHAHTHGSLPASGGVDRPFAGTDTGPHVAVKTNRVDSGEAVASGDSERGLSEGSQGGEAEDGLGLDRAEADDGECGSRGVTLNDVLKVRGVSVSATAASNSSDSDVASASASASKRPVGGVAGGRVRRSISGSFTPERVTVNALHAHSSFYRMAEDSSVGAAGEGSHALNGFRGPEQERSAFAAAAAAASSLSTGAGPSRAFQQQQLQQQISARHAAIREGTNGPDEFLPFGQQAPKTSAVGGWKGYTVDASGRNGPSGAVSSAFATAEVLARTGGLARGLTSLQNDRGAEGDGRGATSAASVASTRGGSSTHLSLPSQAQHVRGKAPSELRSLPLGGCAKGGGGTEQTAPFAGPFARNFGSSAAPTGSNGAGGERERSSPSVIPHTTSVTAPHGLGLPSSDVVPPAASQQPVDENPVADSLHSPSLSLRPPPRLGQAQQQQGQVSVPATRDTSTGAVEVSAEAPALSQQAHQSQQPSLNAATATQTHQHQHLLQTQTDSADSTRRPVGGHAQQQQQAQLSASVPQQASASHTSIPQLHTGRERERDRDFGDSFQQHLPPQTQTRINASDDYARHVESVQEQLLATIRREKEQRDRMKERGLLIEREKEREREREKEMEREMIAAVGGRAPHASKTQHPAAENPTADEELSDPHQQPNNRPAQSADSVGAVNGDRDPTGSCGASDIRSHIARERGRVDRVGFGDEERERERDRAAATGSGNVGTRPPRATPGGAPSLQRDNSAASDAAVASEKENESLGGQEEEEEEPLMPLQSRRLLQGDNLSSASKDAKHGSAEMLMSFMDREGGRGRPRRSRDDSSLRAAKGSVQSEGACGQERDCLSISGSETLFSETAAGRLARYERKERGGGRGGSGDLPLTLPLSALKQTRQPFLPLSIGGSGGQQRERERKTGPGGGVGSMGAPPSGGAAQGQGGHGELRGTNSAEDIDRAMAQLDSLSSFLDSLVANDGGGKGKQQQQGGGAKERERERERRGEATGVAAAAGVGPPVHSSTAPSSLPWVSPPHTSRGSRPSSPAESRSGPMRARQQQQQGNEDRERAPADHHTSNGHAGAGREREKEMMGDNALQPQAPKSDAATDGGYSSSASAIDRRGTPGVRPPSSFQLPRGSSSGHPQASSSAARGRPQGSSLQHTLPPHLTSAPEGQQQSQTHDPSRHGGSLSHPSSSQMLKAPPPPPQGIALQLLHSQHHPHAQQRRLSLSVSGGEGSEAPGGGAATAAAAVATAAAVAAAAAAARQQRQTRDQAAIPVSVYATIDSLGTATSVRSPSVLSAHWERDRNTTAPTGAVLGGLAQLNGGGPIGLGRVGAGPLGANVSTTTGFTGPTHEVEADADALAPSLTASAAATVTVPRGHPPPTQPQQRLGAATLMAQQAQQQQQQQQQNESGSERERERERRSPLATFPQGGRMRERERERDELAEVADGSSIRSHQATVTTPCAGRSTDELRQLEERDGPSRAQPGPSAPGGGPGASTGAQFGSPSLHALVHSVQQQIEDNLDSSLLSQLGSGSDRDLSALIGSDLEALGIRGKLQHLRGVLNRYSELARMLAPPDSSPPPQQMPSSSSGAAGAHSRFPSSYPLPAGTVPEQPAQTGGGGGGQGQRQTNIDLSDPAVARLARLNMWGGGGGTTGVHREQQPAPSQTNRFPLQQPSNGGNGGTGNRSRQPQLNGQGGRGDSRSEDAQQLPAADSSPSNDREAAVASAALSRLGLTEDFFISSSRGEGRGGFASAHLLPFLNGMRRPSAAVSSAAATAGDGEVKDDRDDDEEDDSRGGFRGSEGAGGDENREPMTVEERLLAHVQMRGNGGAGRGAFLGESGRQMGSSERSTSGSAQAAVPAASLFRLSELSSSLQELLRLRGDLDHLSSSLQHGPFGIGGRDRDRHSIEGFPPSSVGARADGTDKTPSVSLSSFSIGVCPLGDSSASPPPAGLHSSTAAAAGKLQHRESPGAAVAAAMTSLPGEAHVRGEMDAAAGPPRAAVAAAVSAAAAAARLQSQQQRGVGGGTVGHPQKHAPLPVRISPQLARDEPVSAAAAAGAAANGGNIEHDCATASRRSGQDRDRDSCGGPAASSRQRDREGSGTERDRELSAQGGGERGAPPGGVLILAPHSAAVGGTGSYPAFPSPSGQTMLHYKSGFSTLPSGADRERDRDREQETEDAQRVDRERERDRDRVGREKRENAGVSATAPFPPPPLDPPACRSASWSPASSPLSPQLVHPPFSSPQTKHAIPVLGVQPVDTDKDIKVRGAYADPPMNVKESDRQSDASRDAEAVRRAMQAIPSSLGGVAAALSQGPGRAARAENFSQDGEKGSASPHSATEPGAACLSLSGNHLQDAGARGSSNPRGLLGSVAEATGGVGEPDGETDGVGGLEKHTSGFASAMSVAATGGGSEGGDFDLQELARVVHGGTQLNEDAYIARARAAGVRIFGATAEAPKSGGSYPLLSPAMSAGDNPEGPGAADRGEVDDEREEDGEETEDNVASLVCEDGDGEGDGDGNLSEKDKTEREVEEEEEEEREREDDRTAAQPGAERSVSVTPPVVPGSGALFDGIHTLETLKVQGEEVIRKALMDPLRVGQQGGPFLQGGLHQHQHSHTHSHSAAHGHSLGGPRGALGAGGGHLEADAAAPPFTRTPSAQAVPVSVSAPMQAALPTESTLSALGAITSSVGRLSAKQPPHGLAASGRAGASMWQQAMQQEQQAKQNQNAVDEETERATIEKFVRQNRETGGEEESAGRSVSAASVGGGERDSASDASRRRLVAEAEGSLGADGGAGRRQASGESDGGGRPSPAGGSASAAGASVAANVATSASLSASLSSHTLAARMENLPSSPAGEAEGAGAGVGHVMPLSRQRLSRAPSHNSSRDRGSERGKEIPPHSDAGASQGRGQPPRGLSEGLSERSNRSSEAGRAGLPDTPPLGPHPHALSTSLQPPPASSGVHGVIMSLAEFSSQEKNGGGKGGASGQGQRQAPPASGVQTVSVPPSIAGGAGAGACPSLQQLQAQAHTGEDPPPLTHAVSSSHKRRQQSGGNNSGGGDAGGGASASPRASIPPGMVMPVAVPHPDMSGGGGPPEEERERERGDRCRLATSSSCADADACAAAVGSSGLSTITRGALDPLRPPMDSSSGCVPAGSEDPTTAPAPSASGRNLPSSSSSTPPYPSGEGPEKTVDDLGGREGAVRSERETFPLPPTMIHNHLQQHKQQQQQHPHPEVGGRESDREREAETEQILNRVHHHHHVPPPPTHPHRGSTGVPLPLPPLPARSSSHLQPIVSSSLRGLPTDLRGLGDRLSEEATDTHESSSYDVTAPSSSSLHPPTATSSMTPVASLTPHPGQPPSPSPPSAGADSSLQQADTETERDDDGLATVRAVRGSPAAGADDDEEDTDAGWPEGPSPPHGEREDPGEDGRLSSSVLQSSRHRGMSAYLPEGQVTAVQTGSQNRYTAETAIVEEEMESHQREGSGGGGEGLLRGSSQQQQVCAEGETPEEEEEEISRGGGGGAADSSGAAFVRSF